MNFSDLRTSLVPTLPGNGRFDYNSKICGPKIFFTLAREFSVMITYIISVVVFVALDCDIFDYCLLILLNVKLFVKLSLCEYDCSFCTHVQVRSYVSMYV